MTDLDDGQRGQDPGAAYRRLATERAPDNLDRKILGMAKKEAAPGAGRNWLTLRIRPLAFVATAGLSLALVVQLSNAPDVDFPAAAEVVGDRQTGTTDTTFQDAARETAEQIRRLEVESGNSLQSRDEGMPRSDAVENAERESLLPVEDRCPDAVRSRSTTWWECIRELEKRGLGQAAEVELQALLKAFPRFSAPQQQ